MERGEIAYVDVHALSPEAFEAELPVVRSPLGAACTGSTRSYGKFPEHFRDVRFPEFTFCDAHHHLIQFSLGVGNHYPIQIEEHQGRSKRHPFVSINEWMILADMKGVRGGHPK